MSRYIQYLLFVASLCFFAPVYLVGQSLNLRADDSHVEIGSINKLDTIQMASIIFYTQLHKSYDSTINSASSQIDHLFLKVDSLQRLGQNTDRLVAKLDSLNQWKAETIKGITSRVEQLKSSLDERVNNLNLPPEMKDKANKFTAMINKLDITIPDTSLPSSFQEYINMSVPDVSAIEVPNIPFVDIGDPLKNVTNLDSPSVSVGDFGEQIKEHQGTISQLPTDLDGAAKLAEEQAQKIGEIGNVQTELGKVGELTSTASTLQDQEKLKKELVQEVQKQAIDHFADKKDHLDNAMQSISKYKQKFSTVTSLNDIPKKAPNEMKGKPLIERIVPGLAFQLQKKDDDLLVDFNLYFGYRFTKRFTAGGGWNQRVGYNTDKNAWSPEGARIYGPRMFSEYKLSKGFSPRVELEVMNTFVPPYLNNAKSDPGSREWVWGAFVGMKKDYTLYKKIKGTAMVMLRLFDPDRKSPYADVVNARFGFEMPIKKDI